MGAKADAGSAPASVVKRYMSAVNENNRADAEQLLASLHMGLPRFGELETGRSAKSSFDWFSYFRDRGYLLAETRVLELSGLWAIVEAKCVLLDQPVASSGQTAIFRLFRERSSWRISDISLSLEANVRRDDSD